MMLSVVRDIQMRDSVVRIEQELKDRVVREEQERERVRSRVALLFNKSVLSEEEVNVTSLN